MAEEERALKLYRSMRQTLAWDKLSTLNWMVVGLFTTWTIAALIAFAGQSAWASGLMFGGGIIQAFWAWDHHRSFRAGGAPQPQREATK